MPSRSKIEKLPAKVIEQLEQRIINQGYKDYDLIAQWAEKEGIDVTRENIANHAAKLKERKSEIMQLREKLKQSGIQPKVRNDRLQSLLMRLGTLHLQEKIIISQIVDLSKVK